ncbi:MAG: universal stress protein [Deltaproteobacteria bacterium]|nr:universal stress protein [Deltaproteobacteria bacterium]
MFTKILFATSGSACCDAAARVAFDLAARYNAKLFVFHALGTPSRGFSQVVVDVRTGEKVELDDDYILWVKDELKTTYDRQLKSGVDCEIDAAVGIPHREVLRKARQEDVDLIVMGASTTGCEADANAYQRHFAGSTLQRVAKASKAPVLVVNRPAASFWGGFTNIVFGADFSKASEHAFKFALKTASELNAHLHVFHAIDIGSNPGLVTQKEIDDRMIEARDRMRRKYLIQAGTFKNLSADIWEGIPYVEIVKFAREKQADLIIMAHHSKDVSEESALFGRTLEQVLLRASCPVASVNRPDKIQTV